MEKLEGKGAYIVPLHNAGEFSGQPFSAMTKRFSSLGASSPSVKQIYKSLYATTCMLLSRKCLIFHLSCVYLMELCEKWWKKSISPVYRIDNGRNSIYRGDGRGPLYLKKRAPFTKHSDVWHCIVDQRRSSYFKTSSYARTTLC